MKQANDRLICSASAETVRTVAMGEVLKHRLRIPFFQRRYCWSPPQWATLLRDVKACCGGRHALGRMTCAVEGDGRLLVIDGQQRTTTCVLFLAACRDAPAADAALRAAVDAVLFPDGAALAAWRAARAPSTGVVVVDDGEALDFAVVVPTYCDRAAFYEAVLPFGARAATAAWRRPAEAKAFFSAALARASTAELGHLVDAVVHRLEWLFFPVRLDQRGDGTSDLFVIFERLALRDATFCKPRRATEYASMGPADLVRNRLLGSFAPESRAEQVYKEAWLPIECAATAGLEAVLAAFLAREAPASAPPLPSLPVGGVLYARFTRFMDEALAAADTDAARERATLGVLRRLRAFAESRLLRADDRPTSSAPTAAAARDVFREEDEDEFPVPAPRRRSS